MPFPILLKFGIADALWALDLCRKRSIIANNLHQGSIPAPCWGTFVPRPLIWPWKKSCRHRWYSPRLDQSFRRPDLSSGGVPSVRSLTVCLHHAELPVCLRLSAGLTRHATGSFLTSTQRCIIIQHRFPPSCARLFVSQVTERLMDLLFSDTDATRRPHVPSVQLQACS